MCINVIFVVILIKTGVQKNSERHGFILDPRIDVPDRYAYFKVHGDLELVQTFAKNIDLWPRLPDFQSA